MIRMKILSLLLILLFASSSLSWAQVEEPDFMEEDDFAARPIEEIEDLFDQRQYQLVIEECKRLIAYDPWRWESKWARLKLSECYAALGQPEKAKASLAEADASISHPRERAEILLWKVHRAVDKGELDHAHELTGELSAKFIGEHHPLEAMGMVAEADVTQDRLENARQLIDQMLKQYPFQDESLAAAISLGERYREGEQHQQAIALFQHLLKIHIDSIEVWAQLANTYQEMEDADKAIEACDTAIATFPGHWAVVQLLSMKGELLQQKGDLQGAIQAFLVAGEFRGTDEGRTALRQAAECYQQLGEANQAIELLIRLSQPGYPDAFTVETLAALAEAYAENSDLDGTEATLKELVESYPQTEYANEAVAQLLEIYWQTDQPTKVADLMRYLLTTSQNPELRLKAIQGLIDLWAEAGEGAEFVSAQQSVPLPEMMQMLRQATAKTSSRAASLVPLSGLAVIAQWAKNWDEAIAVNTRLIEDYPDVLITLDARERLAECYNAKGEVDKALEQVNQILAIAPDGPRAPSAMLRAASYQLEQESRHDEGLKLLRELVERYPNSDEGLEAKDMLEQFESKLSP